MRENAAAKARTYLCEGRIVLTHVSAGRVVATVRGDGALYLAGYRDGVWRCTCPARTPDCAHLRACRLVTAPDLPERNHR